MQLKYHHQNCVLNNILKYTYITIIRLIYSFEVLYSMSSISYTFTYVQNLPCLLRSNTNHYTSEIMFYKGNLYVYLQTTTILIMLQIKIY